LQANLVANHDQGEDHDGSHLFRQFVLFLSALFLAALFLIACRGIRRLGTRVRSVFQSMV
jgi:hypothetical protein